MPLQSLAGMGAASLLSQADRATSRSNLEHSSSPRGPLFSDPETQPSRPINDRTPKIAYVPLRDGPSVPDRDEVWWNRLGEKDVELSFSESPSDACAPPKRGLPCFRVENSRACRRFPIKGCSDEQGAARTAARSLCEGRNRASSGRRRAVDR